MSALVFPDPPADSPVGRAVAAAGGKAAWRRLSQQEQNERCTIERCRRSAGHAPRRAELEAREKQAKAATAGRIAKLAAEARNAKAAEVRRKADALQDNYRACTSCRGVYIQHGSYWPPACGSCGCPA